jgi:hypothetical protein
MRIEASPCQLDDDLTNRRLDHFAFADIFGHAFTPQPGS